jgi:predicted GIY-YIG superfamily endonuclease
LAYFEAVDSRSAAAQREAAIRKLGRAGKERLIQARVLPVVAA